MCQHFNHFIDYFICYKVVFLAKMEIVNIHRLLFQMVTHMYEMHSEESHWDNKKWNNKLLFPLCIIYFEGESVFSFMRN